MPSQEEEVTEEVQRLQQDREVVFKCTDELASTWWLEHVRRVGPTRFFASLRPQPSSALELCVELDLDRHSMTFRGRIEPVPDPGVGELAIIEREVDFSSRHATHHFLKITASKQGEGIAKALLRRTVELYNTIEIKRIVVHAVDVGAYAWARLGYIPSVASWNELRSSLLTKVGQADIRAMLSRDEMQDVKLALQSDDPRSLWTIADIPRLYGERPIGARLLVNMNWKGYFELANDDQMAKFNIATAGAV